MKHNPSLRKKPIAVGGSSLRGVLSTCNYEARKYGCRSAMPVYKALERCPNIILVPSNINLYKKESAAIRNIFFQYTDLVEPLSLDEAFLDVSHHPASAADIASEIRKRIRKECHLPASAGIAPNKLIAKIASDWNKPNGQFEVKESECEAFIRDLPIRKLWGIGPKMEKKLQQQGVITCGQLQVFSKLEMGQKMGKWGLELYDRCRGKDDRPVQPERTRKSLSVEHTYPKDIDNLPEAIEKLKQIHEELLEDIKKNASNRTINGIFVKLTFADFQKTTVSHAHLQPSWENFPPLLEEGLNRSQKGIRLLGIGVRFLEEEGIQAEQLVFEF